MKVPTKPSKDKPKDEPKAALVLRFITDDDGRTQRSAEKWVPRKLSQRLRNAWGVITGKRYSRTVYYFKTEWVKKDPAENEDKE